MMLSNIDEIMSRIPRRRIGGPRVEELAGRAMEQQRARVGVWTMISLAIDRMTMPWVMPIAQPSL